jgi:FixJ family two-component response regulator
MPIIFITGDGVVPMTVQAMKAGAAEFLTKPFSSDVLLAYHPVSSPARPNRISCQAEMRAAYRSLSAREREVMALVIAGLLNK